MLYCISDIHGCSKTLKALLETINVKPEDTIYFLGDYIDRGTDSKGVLDIVMNIDNAICHKGNHEDMLLKAILNPDDNSAFVHWMRNGGDACLKSFGTMAPSDDYLEFIKNLQLITELDDFYLCHAGIQDDAMGSHEEVILWDRYCEIDLNLTGGRRLICGHTPTDLATIKKDSVVNNKIIIDAGCVFHNRPGYGNLVALRLDDMKIFEQRNIDF